MLPRSSGPDWNSRLVLALDHSGSQDKLEFHHDPVNRPPVAQLSVDLHAFEEPGWEDAPEEEEEEEEERRRRRRRIRTSP